MSLGSTPTGWIDCHTSSVQTHTDTHSAQGRSSPMCRKRKEVVTERWNRCSEPEDLPSFSADSLCYQQPAAPHNLTTEQKTFNYSQITIIYYCTRVFICMNTFLHIFIEAYLFSLKHKSIKVINKTRIICFPLGIIKLFWINLYGCNSVH